MTLNRSRNITSGVATGLLWAAMGLWLSGCGASQTGNAKASVIASEASLAAIGNTVLACYSVPSCAKVAPKAQIKQAYDAAYKAATAAQASADAGNTPDLTATTAALTVLQGVIAQLPPS